MKNLTGVPLAVRNKNKFTREIQASLYKKPPLLREAAGIKNLECND